MISPIRVVSFADEESCLVDRDLKWRVAPWKKNGRHVVKRIGYACVR